MDIIDWDVSQLYPHQMQTTHIKFFVRENERYHNETGPAIVYIDDRVEWMLHGLSYSLEDYCKKLHKDEWEVYFTKYSLMY